MDTLTIRDHLNQPVPGVGGIALIPVRFHVYWAGSDKDDAVAGFYYAVVETSVTAIPGLGVPQLPGPKPGDYRFTSKTDTTFIFTVSDLITERQHAFYIYAVDSRGKPDPTPARFVFSAFDRAPPRPVFDVAQASGQIVVLAPDGSPIVQDYARAITDTLNPRTEPTDTVAAYSRVDFVWHGQITQPGTYVTGYRYKLDEPQFVVADSSVHAVSYGTGLPGSSRVSPGTKLFTLRALDQAGGAGEVTRRFVMNFSPDTWWAGPDPDLFPPPDPTDPYSDGEYNSQSVIVTSWPGNLNPVFTTDPPLPPGTFGTDSAQYRPSMRMPPGNDFTRPGTFYELYKDRIYARTEGDTVHQNSWVVLWNGGYDKDSRYQIRADTTDPALLDQNGHLITGPLVDAADRVGSPIGFRSLIASKLTPSGVRTTPAQTSLYPDYEPRSVFRAPRVGGYWRMFQAGKAYAMASAEDADGGIDNAITDPAALADAVDGGGGTPEEQALRRKVLVFYVDKAPALVRDGSFLPQSNEVINTAQWDFQFNGMDLDPFDPTIAGYPAGGPTPNEILRYRFTLYGKNLAGRDTSWTYLEPNGTPFIQRGSAPQISFVPGGTGRMADNPFATGTIRVSIEVCDCIDCENSPGRGRCVQGIDPVSGTVLNPRNVISVRYTRPAGAADLQTQSTGDRPGPASAGGRH